MVEKEIISASNKNEFNSIKMWNLNHEEIKKLGELGFNTFYALSGMSIKELAKKEINKHQFWNNPNIFDKNESVYSLDSNPIQVLINPKKIIIPRSGDKTFEEHKKLIDKNTAKLVDMGIIHAKFTILKASHVAELMLEHITKSNEFLLGSKGRHKYPFVNTDTITNKNKRISIGCYSEALGFRICSGDKNIKDPNILALNVLVPA